MRSVNYREYQSFAQKLISSNSFLFLGVYDLKAFIVVRYIMKCINWNASPCLIEYMMARRNSEIINYNDRIRCEQTSA